MSRCNECGSNGECYKFCDWSRGEYEEHSDSLEQRITELEQEKAELVEVLESCYNIDAKYIDNPNATYRDYHLDVMDILMKALIKIKGGE